MTNHLLKEHPRKSQFALFLRRQFGPFFSTQFLGACNDNIFKFSITLLITYQWRVQWLDPSLAGLLIGALFILPFILFSALSGLLADQFNKTRIMQSVKLLELLIMALAYWGLTQQLPSLLMVCVFLMGLHSTLFGPAKYAYLPTHLGKSELIAANSLVEAGTFLAILLGNIIGGLLLSQDDGVLKVFGYSKSESLIAYVCLFLSLLGIASSLFIPSSRPEGAPKTGFAFSPLLKQALHPLGQTFRSLRSAQRITGMSSALYGISWMWFYGAVFLSLFPSLTKQALHANSDVASLLLVVFSIGIALGSLMCSLIHHPKFELSLVLIGLIGMAVFTVDLAFALTGLTHSGPVWSLSPQMEIASNPEPALLSVTQFIGSPGHMHALFDLTLLSASIGLFSVPLYTFIQTRSPSESCAQTVAANNVLNAVFMITSALLVGVFLSLGLSIAQVFLILGLSNMFWIWYLTKLLPELSVHSFERIREFIINFKNPF
jgi:MFS family permease